MDPQAALAEFWTAYKAADEAAEGDSNDAEISALRECADIAFGLFLWLRNGGFAPDWRKS